MLTITLPELMSENRMIPDTLNARLGDRPNTSI